jgi:hypothetical protein
MDYIPFSSEDLDFYGGKIEAIACQRILGGTINLNQDFGPSPDAGLSVWYRYGLEIESAIPQMGEVSIRSDKWDDFGLVRLPQIYQEIIKKRSRYLEARANIEARVTKNEDLPMEPERQRYQEFKKLGMERVDFQGLHPDLRGAKIALECGLSRDEIIRVLEQGDFISSWHLSIIDSYRERYLNKILAR